MREWLRENWLITLAWIVAVGLMVLIAGAGIAIILEDVLAVQTLEDCQLGGYMAMTSIGDVPVCVGVQLDGEYIAVPVETVRARLGER